MVDQLGHAHGKLVARQPGQEVVRLQHRLRQRAGVLGQDIVGADLEDLVDLAVVGNMDQQHGAAGLGQPRLRDRLVQPAAEGDAVRHRRCHAVLAHRALPARGGTHGKAAGAAGNARAAPRQPGLVPARQAMRLVRQLIGQAGFVVRRQQATRLRAVDGEHQRAQRGQPARQPGGVRQAGGIDAGARRDRARATGAAQVRAGRRHQPGASDDRHDRRATPQPRALAQPLHQQLGSRGGGRGGSEAGRHLRRVVGRRHAARQHHHQHGHAYAQLRQQCRRPGQRAQRAATG
ncbi:hypothetical protein D9M72_228880 [compost metagenome]